jgi:hypothetical protein
VIPVAIIVPKSGSCFSKDFSDPKEKIGTDFRPLRTNFRPREPNRPPYPKCYTQPEGLRAQFRPPTHLPPHLLKASAQHLFTMTFLEHTSKATVALGVGILHGVRGLVPRRIGTDELPSQPTNKFENPLSSPLPFRQSAVPFDLVADENPS